MRELKGWSQEQLARMMGYKSKSTINKIEKNVNDVNQTTLDKFARVFKCDTTDLLVESFATPEEFELAWHRSGGGRHPLQLSDTEHEMILAYRCADNGTQSSVLKLLDIVPKEKNADAI
jgi:transcriptional regulator with XRE-family HTH domain